MTTDCSTAPDDAVRQVLAHRTMLKAYIRAIVRHPTLAEDTFSDVTLAIINSWHRYDPNRPFETWARGVARRVSLANLRKEAKQPCPLDEEVLELLGQELDAIGNEPALEQRKEALKNCVESLSPKHRQLIEFRYFENRSYQEISGLVGKTVGTLYVVFNRLHKLLSACIEHRLGQM